MNIAWRDLADHSVPAAKREIFAAHLLNRLSCPTRSTAREINVICVGRLIASFTKGGRIVNWLPWKWSIQITVSRPSENRHDPRELLTESQLACLRSARTKITNKNIAIDLGISPNTVAQHLKEARLRLGDVTRSAAVEIVDTWDHQHPHDSTSGPQGVVSDVDYVMMRSSPASVGVPNRARVNILREERAQFGATPDLKDPSLLRLVQHWLESFNGEFGAKHRGKMVIWAAVALGVLTLILVAVGESLNRTLHSLGY